MTWANRLISLTLLPARSVLMGCSNSDDDDDAAPIPQIPTVQPSGYEDPEVNNFPFISKFNYDLVNSNNVSVSGFARA